MTEEAKKWEVLLSNEKIKKYIAPIVIIICLLLGMMAMSADRLMVVNELTDPLYEGNLNQVPEGYTEVEGALFVSTMINLLETEINRPLGGYRPDNIVWYGGLMPFDNVENFQMGVVEVVQRTAIFLKERVSRAGGGSDQFDALLEQASESLNYRKSMPILSRMQINDGIRNLKEYRDALAKNKSVFVVRTDALYDLFRSYGDLLGDTHQNLAKWLEKDGSPVSTFDTDDYFYHSLGEAYALLAMMRASRIEFKDILQEKGCNSFLDELEKSLVHATEDNPPWIILNGDIYAQFWPNHRSNADTYIYDARFKLKSMMETINR